MKKLFIIMAMVLGVMGTCIAADDPPEVEFKLKMKVDPYGGNSWSYQYEMTCTPVEDCFIVNQDKIYVPKIGDIYVVKFCNSWGLCTDLLFKSEE